MTDMSDAILDAARMHVPFDGWTEASFVAAVADAGVPMADARTLFPRGAVDLAVAFHRRGDQALAKALSATDLSALRFRERVAHAVKVRLDLVEDDKEAVRRGATLFALPVYAADGARLVWETADVIWTGLGDGSRDLNWYTKRATLAGVYSATVLYWLGDQTEGHTATWAFLDRRIGDVMRIEEMKSKVRSNALLKPFAAGLDRFAASVRAPRGAGHDDLPGRWTPPA
ncbi:COQ9 family protein [Rhodobacteraceae bacterium N5(2021)]|uniref:COQ9 family protein n=1 Tax=Gymnodinialimonas phycosphaerae TaxID=2841589 RepID=A0A975YEK0_9RHOB|nr:COQ9 family protein [Gymnodinialimonas phycosphaerae]MBY4893753.1 COQ9 family protein [Gymnodinialimonas phycosphaerae]